MTDSSPSVSPLDASEEHLLQSALETAFTPIPSVPRVPAIPPVAGASTSEQKSSTAEPAQLSAGSSVSESLDEESWKAEYESHVKAWRAQSAEARAKAEKERARWEEIRKAERDESLQKKLRGEISEEASQSEMESVGHDWQTVGAAGASTLGASSISAAPSTAFLSISPSPTDVRDLVSGERQATSGHVPETGHSKAESGSPSGRWEDIPSSLTSSFPSMSFPEVSRATSPHFRSSHSHPQRDPRHDEDARKILAKNPIATSTLPSILDSSLSPRTRWSLLLSSLSINFLLPFINGVMMGFGEVFARNVIAPWIGWKRDGHIVTQLGAR